MLPNEVFFTYTVGIGVLIIAIIQLVLGFFALQVLTSLKKLIDDAQNTVEDIKSAKEGLRTGAINIIGFLIKVLKGKEGGG